MREYLWWTKLVISNFYATNQLVVVLVDYCIFKKLNHSCITFDIDINGEESDMKKILCSIMGKKWEHDVWCLFEENEARFDWSVYLVFSKLRCFSSMLPSMPKGEIVSMNVNDNTWCGSILGWCVILLIYVQSTIITEL